MTHARAIALSAWEEVRHFHRGDFEIYEKPGEGPATEADVLADRHIVNALQKTFPTKDFGYLSEEQLHGDDRLSRRWCWIIDPIDGTKDFIDGGEDFAVHIGLAGWLTEGAPAVPLAGIVYRPTHGLVYSARLGGGAWCEDLQTGEKRRITAGTQASAGESRLVVTSSEIPNKLRKAIGILGIGDVYQMGSLGLKIVEVADAKADLFLNTGRRKCKEWDVCAPQIILEEAGGRITDLNGQDIVYIQRDIHVENGLVASNGAIHNEVVQLLTENLVQ